MPTFLDPTLLQHCITALYKYFESILILDGNIFISSRKSYLFESTYHFLLSIMSMLCTFLEEETHSREIILYLQYQLS